MVAILAAVQKNSQSAPQIAHVATAARPEFSRDILRTSFRGVGVDSKDDATERCGLLNRIYREVVAGDPRNASALTQLAIELAPNCASSFGRGGGGGDDEGNFGNPPGNQNAPPGSIGGGGGQGNVIAICHNGVTIFLTPQAAEADLRNNPGDRLGPCVVTPNQNN